MSRGKHLSLEEAREEGKLDRFAKEHPSEAERPRFNALVDAMCRGVLVEEETSPRGRASGSSGTRTRRGT